MVECDLAKVDVEGSNPFRRSILLRSKLFSFELRRDLQLQDCCRFYEAIGSRRVEGEVDPSAAPNFSIALTGKNFTLRR